MPKKPKVFIAKINLTYKDESRLASIYEDGTAVFDTGETVTLSQAQIDKIKQKKAEAEEAAAVAKLQRAAQAAQKRYEEEKKRKAIEAEYAAAREAAQEAQRFSQQSMYDDYPEEVEEEIYDSVEEDYNSSHSRSYKDEYDDLDIPDPKSTRKKAVKVVLATVGLFAVCGGILFGSFYLLDNHLTRVSVAQFSTSVAKDQQITPDNLERLKMPESIYQELTDAAPGEIVLWEDAQSIVGQYAAMDAIAGQYVTTDYITDSITENLWKADMSSDQEMVNLDFDRFDLDEIYPGSHISIRAVVTLPDSSAPKVMSISEAANIGEEQEETVAPTEETASAEEPDNPDGTQEEQGENTEVTEESENEEESSVAPDAAPGDSQDTFNDVVVVDLKNNYNDSIFDLYLGLASMTPEDRKEYLTERAQSSNAASYRESLTPTVLVLALDGQQARDLSVVKNMSNATLELTSIPSSNYDSTDEQNSLLMKFKEVDRDIREIFSAVRTN